ncbi:hypothetical protein ADL22_03480 [Streptomyces sp. NRRL F-4489]|uniref:hypothetical protein n=1 Tax=Streptomyces sp. NRRL F-4489 TaxID=1609095 RepID=UPI00074B0A24|nr:hypothetical protein [Streptomyces sp. NRRL F-4489]KUL53751.1 hypothetical protein ADL22_03480 [Streptomyces sp. NRRL F-4489]
MSTNPDPAPHSGSQPAPDLATETEVEAEARTEADTEPETDTDQASPTQPLAPPATRAPQPRGGSAAAALIFDDPLSQRSADDTDRGWGERPGGGDSAADLARFLDEKPPHHL